MNTRHHVLKEDTVRVVGFTLSSWQIDSIKLAAFIAMVADHANTAFQLHNDWLLLVGRIAFPLFALAWGINQGRNTEIKQAALNSLWRWALIAQPCYYLVVMNAGTAFWQLNILFTFAVAGQCIKWFQGGITSERLMAIILVIAYLPLSLTSYFIFGLLLLWCSRWLFSQDAMAPLFWRWLVWAVVVVMLNLHVNTFYALSGLVGSLLIMSVMVTINRTMKRRRLPRHFFVVGYVWHLAILGVLSL